ncbi:aldehyde dehydrogenase family protein [Nocardioides soli]|uniref:Acyl-CoA reductase-like NAD-dependent aldehyde dehydrogenase n=1 Tax=Nocardioides soli TaxID=1036020 RepID=A0A7W4Z493_9ACTN|nr:acyl-CoA reductase-like NAD-dependent aldehyde dehydrogenase [Nocardioides soli]
MTAQRVFSEQRRLVIDGAETDGVDKLVTRVVDPATGELAGTTAYAGAGDVDKAVEAAHRAQPDWASAGPDARARVLHRAADLVRERVDEIAWALTLEQGKPVPDSRKEILFGAEVLDYYAEEGKRLHGEVRTSAAPDVRSVVSWAPVGIVGAIVPWNYPVDLYCWKIGPALAAGNAMIVKPPHETPFAVGLLVRCLLDAGLPAGVLNDLPGGIEAGQRLAAHPDVDMITATASTATGQALMRTAADTMKRVSLELGGQCPFVVLDDAELELAAQAAFRRSFSNAGQICIAVNRVLVAESVADDFVAAVAELADSVRLGHGLDDGVLYGPATNAGVLARAADHVEDAVRLGAKVVAGGSVDRSEGLAGGHFYRPTVIDGVPLGARVMSEETFGPVLGIHRYAEGEDPVRLANATRYGLAAYVYGRDLERAWSVADRIEAGGVGVNINDVSELQAPFGGWKLSGFGRELGPEGLRGFSQQRHVRLRLRASL